MKFLVSLLLIMLLSFAAGLYLPWWTIAITSFLVVALIPQRPGAAFLCGFTAIFLLWAALSFWLSFQNNHILAHKISLLILSIDNPLLLILVTALIGALVAGFAAITASFARRVTI
jgi:hypothetical protein